MGNAFQDQFLKAGLVDSKKVKQAKKQSYEQQRKQDHGNQVAKDNEAKRLAEQAQRDKAERDRELNARIQAEQAQKAIQAQVRQLIDTHRITAMEGELKFNFTDGDKIKTLYLTAPLQQQLARGQLAVTRHGEGYALIPAPIALKIAERDASVILLLNSKDQTAAQDDDPYAKYQVPDDLMW